MGEKKRLLEKSISMGTQNFITGISRSCLRILENYKIKLYQRCQYPKFNFAIGSEISLIYFDHYQANLSNVHGGNNNNNGGNTFNIGLFDSGDNSPAYFYVAAIAEAEDESYKESDIGMEENFKKDYEYNEKNSLQQPHNQEFLIAEISTFNLPIGRGIPTLNDITKELNTQVGFSSSKEDLNKDLKKINEKFREILSPKINQNMDFV